MSYVIENVVVSIMPNTRYVLNETNTDVCVCTLVEFISSRCGHIAVQLEKEILNGINTALYIITWIDMRSSQVSLTTISEKYNWHIDTLVRLQLQFHEKVSLWDQDMWNVIPLFASCLKPVSVNWYLHWL